VVVLPAFEGGLRVGQYLRRSSQQEDRPPVGKMVAATLDWLAFMLGFTFGLAALQFDVGRGLVIDKATWVGTTSLRRELFPMHSRTEVRNMTLRASDRPTPWSDQRPVTGDPAP
jgi:hypothetical protein